MQACAPQHVTTYAEAVTVKLARVLENVQNPDCKVPSQVMYFHPLALSICPYCFCCMCAVAVCNGTAKQGTCSTFF